MRNYCGISVSPLRKDPSDRAEMVSQVLYGEQFIIIERFKDWYLIEMQLDAYQGWMDARAILEINYDAKPVFIHHELMIRLKNKSEGILLSYGSELIPDKKNKTNTTIGSFLMPEDVSIDKPNTSNRLNQIIQDCLLFLNVPYLWGGRSAFGIDCSGLIQIVFKVNGIILTRDAADQAKMGTEVEFKNRKKGDLAYFKNSENKISHVGILLNDKEILHSSGWVRIDEFSEVGITSKIENKISHTLAFIKRLPYTA